MKPPAKPPYPAKFKGLAVKLALEGEKSIAQTARDLGVNENTPAYLDRSCLRA